MVAASPMPKGGKAIKESIRRIEPQVAPVLKAERKDELLTISVVDDSEERIDSRFESPKGSTKH